MARYSEELVATAFLSAAPMLLCGSTAPLPNKEWPPAVEVQMRNVNLRLDRSTVLEIRELRGRMPPGKRAQPVTFDDLESFAISIDKAELAITTQTMSDLLNQRVFAYHGAPLKDIRVTARNGKIKQTGTMHKGLDMPFELEGPLTVTSEGEIQLHAEKIRSAHIPFKGLLHLFGEDLSNLINVKRARGVRVEGDDVFLNPTAMLPPPRMEGRATAVRVEGDRIVLTFASKQVELKPPRPAANYIYFRGGVLRFGKLTMQDADLEIVDLSPRTPFDFNLPDYDRQLVAGYSKNTPAHGLMVFMPDYGSLQGR